MTLRNEWYIINNEEQADSLDCDNDTNKQILNIIGDNKFKVADSLKYAQLINGKFVINDGGTILVVDEVPEELNSFLFFTYEIEEAPPEIEAFFPILDMIDKQLILTDSEIKSLEKTKKALIEMKKFAKNYKELK